MSSDYIVLVSGIILVGSALLTYIREPSRSTLALCLFVSLSLILPLEAFIRARIMDWGDLGTYLFIASAFGGYAYSLYRLGKSRGA